MSEITELFRISQDGSMHVANARGISLESLMSSLMFATVYCAIQLFSFYYLQSKFPSFYDKYGVNKVKPKKGNIKCKSVVSFCLYYLRNRNNILDFLSIKEYKRYGMDSYLFLRFLYVCLYFFVGISIVCLPVLIPINFLATDTGNNNIDATHVSEISTEAGNINSGLDLISILNIPSNQFYKYIFHFLVTIFIVFWFHYILIHEINFFKELKIKFYRKLTTFEKGQNYLKIMYIENINTERYPTINSLKKVFEQIIPDCIDTIYPIYYSNNLIKLVERYDKLVDELDQYIEQLQDFKQGKLLFKPKNFKYLPFKIFNSEYEIVIVGICDKVDKYKYLNLEINRIWNDIKLLQDNYLSNDYLEDPKISSGKVFIKFKKISYNYIINQIDISKGSSLLNYKLIEINPRDIQWDKMMKDNQNNNFWIVIKDALLFFIAIAVIICWVIPVACVGTLAQLDYLTMLIPTIKWINRTPEKLKDFISWILPTVVLTFLTTFGMLVFRLINNQKRILIGSLNEINMQKWIFIFLFFQLFIVITISSGFILILQKLVSNPISIMQIIAVDFPKASNFFISFFILKGLTLLGNNVLQFYYFFQKCIINDLILNLNKSKRKSLKKEFKDRFDNENYWGQIYPTFSVYGSIGIVYSIISPVVVIFCCINFTLNLIGYKYSIKYVLNRTNKSETNGKMYINNIKQMYAGIYSLEIFEIGHFFSIKDEHGYRKCIVLSVLLFLILGITAYVHLNINSNDKSLDLNLLQEIESEPDNSVGADGSRLQYLHSSFSTRKRFRV